VIFQDFPGAKIFKKKNPGLSRWRGNPAVYALAFSLAAPIHGGMARLSSPGWLMEMGYLVHPSRH